MSYNNGPRIVTNGLVLCLDAGNSKSYPGTGTVWNDLSGNNNNGTLTNGPTFNSSNGGSIVFDGSNDYVEVPTTSSINDCLASDFSYEMWSFPKTSGFQFGKIFGKGAFQSSTGYNGLTYSTTSFNCSFAHVLGSRTMFNLPPNKWYHLVITRIGTTLKGYVNGNNTSTHTGISFNYSGNFPLRLSANSQPTPDTTAQNLSIFKQYNRGLTDLEIIQNYNATKGRFNL